MERILPGEYKWRHGIRHLDTDGVGYRYDEYTGTYYYNNNPVSFNEVYYNYIVPNSSWTLVFPETLYAIVDDPAVQAQNSKLYQDLADTYNKNTDLVNRNDEALAAKFEEIFFMTKGKLNLTELTTRPGNKGMTPEGLYFDLTTKKALAGFTEPTLNGGNAIHVAPYCLGNDGLIKAYGGHELIHLYHNVKTFYDTFYTETIAYKYTVDILNEYGFYSAAKGEISVAMENGWWYETNGFSPLLINKDRAYIFVIGK